MIWLLAMPSSDGSGSQANQRAVSAAGVARGVVGGSPLPQAVPTKPNCCVASSSRRSSTCRAPAAHVDGASALAAFGSVGCERELGRQRRGTHGVAVDGREAPGASGRELVAGGDQGPAEVGVLRTGREARDRLEVEPAGLGETGVALVDAVDGLAVEGAALGDQVRRLVADAVVVVDGAVVAEDVRGHEQRAPHPVRLAVDGRVLEAAERSVAWEVLADRPVGVASRPRAGSGGRRSRQSCPRRDSLMAPLWWK